MAMAARIGPAVETASASVDTPPIYYRGDVLRFCGSVEESERRYRHLVDNSPDIVWSVDADGIITYVSDSLEPRSGWKPEQIIGQPYSVLIDAENPDSAAAWSALRESPDEEHRLRTEMPLPDGRRAQVEVAMTGTIALSACGRAFATWMAVNPPYEMPHIPTLPEHHGWAASQATASTPSRVSSAVYSSRATPKDDPVPRTSTRQKA